MTRNCSGESWKPPDRKVSVRVDPEGRLEREIKVRERWKVLKESGKDDRDNKANNLSQDLPGIGHDHSFKDSVFSVTN